MANPKHVHKTEAIGVSSDRVDHLGPCSGQIGRVGSEIGVVGKRELRILE